MALLDTIPALNCVSYCDTVRTISEESFLDYVIDALSTLASTPVADITSSEIQTAVDDALCSMEGIKNSTVSPEHKMGIILALLAML